jgi:FkbM family methyltransferase
MILYGNGELGKLASRFFDFYKIDYIICEDTPSQEGVITLDDITDKNTQILICISTVSYAKIVLKLNEKGFTNIKSFFEIAEQINKANGYKHPLTNGWQKSNWKESEENNCDKVADSFVDNKSKDNYYSFIHWHQFYQEFFYPNQEVNCNDRYFIPEVLSVLHDHEVFIDAGAYDGRVTKKFTEIVNNKFNRICLIEPQIEHYLIQSIDEILNINLYNTCLGNKDGDICFDDTMGYLCKVVKESKRTVYIRKLDTLSKINNIEPTFIKIHVEGYELEVLKGAIKTIKKYRPIVAVTTYHTEEGLYKLPLYLIKNLKDYNFYWRNHNYQGQGAVMYCIPRERNKK